MNQEIFDRRSQPMPESVTQIQNSSSTSALEKCYAPFLITLIVIFGLGCLTVGYSYYFGLFAVAIGFSICNFIVAMDNRFGTSPWDLVIMILACVSLIPLLGWFTQMAALAFSIVALIKKQNA
jgi:hypothetical protein